MGVWVTGPWWWTVPRAVCGGVDEGRVEMGLALQQMVASRCVREGGGGGPPHLGVEGSGQLRGGPDSLHHSWLHLEHLHTTSWSLHSLYGDGSHEPCHLHTR